MIIFEGERGIVDYDILATTMDGTRKFIVRGRVAIRVTDQIIEAITPRELIEKEALLELRKLVDEFEKKVREK